MRALLEGVEPLLLLVGRRRWAPRLLCHPHSPRGRTRRVRMGGQALLLAGLLMTAWIHRVDSVKPFYRHFDDYLTSIGRKRSDVHAGDGMERSEPVEHRNVVTRGTSAAPGRRNISCCMLGELAGDKGFHCYVEYYAARIAMRNRNRAHNRKLGFYGRYRAPNYGHHLMKTFERCVAGQGAIFHKCCHLATLEKREAGETRARQMQPRQKNNRSKARRSNGTLTEREDEDLEEEEEDALQSLM